MPLSRERVAELHAIIYDSKHYADPLTQQTLSDVLNALRELLTVKEKLDSKPSVGN